MKTILTTTLITIAILSNAFGYSPHKEEFLKQVQYRGLATYSPIELAFALDEFCYALEADSTIKETWMLIMNEWKNSKERQFYYYHSDLFFTSQLEKKYLEGEIPRSCYHFLKNSIPKIEPVTYDNYYEFYNKSIVDGEDVDYSFMLTLILFSDKEFSSIESNRISKSYFEDWIYDRIYDVRINYPPKAFINKRIAEYLVEKHKDSHHPYIKQAVAVFEKLLGVN
ncbi:MAG: hypothetical protein PHD06_02925 [Bacteroidales bacterium]|jgi:hypothetical protein|nr:hypothetical protein [Bacteroidales bacterium]MDD4384111.1 hypothetical protein [Bacteroidales bacterium]MDY0197198.1 hypothetical protein [Tenuifilaceae bacterium]